MKWRKIGYGVFFVVVLPCLLVLWAVAARDNVALPAYGNAAIGEALVAFAAALMSFGMLELWRFGGGLPMNAFPPPKFVSHGAFRFVPHPIYTGFVAAVLGISMIAGSTSGLWLVTPSVALGCAALVLGYERPDLLRRFGHVVQILPADEESPPAFLERVRFVLHVIIPWLALYEFTIRLPLPSARIGFAFEEHLPVLPWTALIYESVYVAVALAPWAARSRRDLRRLTIAAWVAMLVVFPIYWFFPLTAPRRPLADSNWMTHLLAIERGANPPTAAFPSFHVLWALLVGRLYRPKWIGWAYGGAVGVSCVTTGMHYVADVVAAIAIAPMLLEPQAAWEKLRRWAERLANSWHEWRVGPVRIINHGFYAGAAAMAQAGMALAGAGPALEWRVLATASAGIVSAAAWAQWVEGSSRLRRPYGFYGALIGTCVACLFFRERWILLAAHALGAPWTQAIGRLRCLVNGCCHGCATTPQVGIKVSHPRSRVTRLAGLTGVPIHATQIYSILGNLVLGLLLMRMWISGCPVLLICGVYGMGNGLSRFVEEAYRGEPQTPVVWGLRLYQWLAIATVFIGAALTCVSSPAAPALAFSLADAGLAAVFALCVSVAMGVDLPESNRPLARLT
jgi:protein-S-isoprenylcysteine O-methyltransferase Ste14